jgi:hypothetical protein
LYCTTWALRRYTTSSWYVQPGWKAAGSAWLCSHEQAHSACGAWMSDNYIGAAGSSCAPTILLHRTNTADQADGPEIALVIQ